MHYIIGKEILFTKDIQLNHSNSSRSRSKYYSDNVIDSNYNVGNELDNKELWLDNFESLE